MAATAHAAMIWLVPMTRQQVFEDEEKRSSGPDAADAGAGGEAVPWHRLGRQSGGLAGEGSETAAALVDLGLDDLTVGGEVDEIGLTREGVEVVEVFGEGVADEEHLGRGPVCEGRREGKVVGARGV